MDDENNEFLNLENAIRERIRQARKDKGLNQETMGKMLGISKTSYSEIEGGKTSLPLSRFLHISKILELDDIFKPKEEGVENQLVEINNFHDLLKQFVVQNGKVDTLAKDVQEIKADMVSKTDFEQLKTLIIELLSKDKDTPADSSE